MKNYHSLQLSSMVYVINLAFAIWAMWPNKKLNDVDENDNDSLAEPEPKGQLRMEMQSIGMKSPTSMRSTPFTPRTQAFNTLDRQLPLRQQAEPRYG